MKELTQVLKRQKLCHHREMLIVTPTWNKMVTDAFLKILWWIRIHSSQERQTADFVSDSIGNLKRRFTEKDFLLQGIWARHHHGHFVAVS
jgi:hypothetical protein